MAALDPIRTVCLPNIVPVAPFLTPSAAHCQTLSLSVSAFYLTNATMSDRIRETRAVTRASMVPLADGASQAPAHPESAASGSSGSSITHFDLTNSGRGQGEDTAMDVIQPSQVASGSEGGSSAES